VMSTDPAHSLGDSFNMEIGDKPKRLKEDLFGLEIDVHEELSRNWGKIQSFIKKNLVAVAKFNDLVAEEFAVFPGMEELFSLLRLKSFHDKGEYDVALLDCSPTASTMRMLSFPDIAGWYMEKFFHIERRIMKMVRPVLGPMIEVELPNDEVYGTIEVLYQNIDGVKEILCDDKVSSMRLVMNPEKMVYKESQRAYSYLNLFGFPVDAVVIGEGEETIIELLNTLSAGLEPTAIKGIAYKKDGFMVMTPSRPLIQDLDALPFPKHELFMTPEREMACILTNRGCPFKCSFCCLHTISRRKFRKRSVKNAVDEVEYIVNTFKNIKIIQIADDTFTLDLQRAMDFCKEIVRRKIKIKFYCSARIKPVSVELFKLMEAAGFSSIGFGLETGSAKLLKSIHKSITREDAIETFNMLKGININISTFLMVGFPGEDKETVAETIDLIQKLQKIKYFEFAGVARLWVYPNTEIYDLLRDAGRIDDSFWLTDKDVPFFTLEHSAEELERMVTQIAMACTPKRQWIKRISGELRRPGLFFKKLIPRLRKVWKVLESNM